MSKIRQFFNALFHKPRGIQINVKFPTGEKRRYYVHVPVAEEVDRGALLQLEFAHPKYGEIAKVTLKERTNSNG